MEEQNGEKPDFTNYPETDQKIDGFTPEQVEATLKRLEEVLAEDTPQVEEISEQAGGTDEETSLEDLQKRLEEGEGIRVLPEAATDERGPYSEDFIRKAKKALEEMLSSEVRKDGPES